MLNVKDIWRYPVKSMLGEKLETSLLDSIGMVGDRAFALLDVETGKIASMKNPRLWGNLLNCQASLDNTFTRITLPNDVHLISNQAGCDAVLSDYLGRTVELRATSQKSLDYEVYAPDAEGFEPQKTLVNMTLSQAATPGTFFNYAPLHLLTTASLAALKALSGDDIFEVARFRPNVLIESDQEAFIENDWVGKTLAIGETVRLHVTMTCPRCVATTLAQNDDAIKADKTVLRHIAQHNQQDFGVYGKFACLGIYANVMQAGTIKVGDNVQILS